MGTELEPAYWQARAEETRTLADGMTANELKNELIRIADDYEHLAKIAEELKKHPTKH